MLRLRSLDGDTPGSRLDELTTFSYYLETITLKKGIVYTLHALGFEF